MLYKNKILAIIPAFNESTRITPVITGTLSYLPVLVIDDGSSDNTPSAAEASGAEVICQTPNQGKGVALRVGFKHAINGDFHAVLTLDADGQHDPADIPKFLDCYSKKHPDLIIGNRDFSQIPPVRRIANSIGALMISWALGQSIPDNQSGYRLIGYRLMQELLRSEEQGFEFEVEMIATCIKLGMQLDWVPIRTIYAGESSHIQPLNHTFEFIRIVLQTRRKF